MLAMAANVIVAESLTVAGSIGVVSSKLNLEVGDYGGDCGGVSWCMSMV